MIFLFIAAFGFWMGTPQPKKASLISSIQREKKFPLIENKSFVFVIYGYNQALWCERALTSIFEQDFDHYRVIFIDDASTDATGAIVTQYVLDNKQEGKVVLMRNQESLGRKASLRRAIDQCLDREIVIALNAQDWLVSPFVLNQLNLVYQNPDIWAAVSSTLEYPSYEESGVNQSSFYADLLKKSPQARGDSMEELLESSGGRVRKVETPISFFNSTSFTSSLN